MEVDKVEGRFKQVLPAQTPLYLGQRLFVPGRAGFTDAAASRVSSTELVISTASPPSAAPSAESVSVDRNTVIAANPSIDTTM